MNAASSRLKKAATRMITEARNQDMVFVGFAIPNKFSKDEFGWTLFSTCAEEQANDLAITIGEILKDAAKNTIQN